MAAAFSVQSQILYHLLGRDGPRPILLLGHSSIPRITTALSLWGTSHISWDLSTLSSAPNELIPAILPALCEPSRLPPLLFFPSTLYPSPHPHPHTSARSHGRPGLSRRDAGVHVLDARCREPAAGGPAHAGDNCRSPGGSVGRLEDAHLGRGCLQPCSPGGRCECQRNGIAAVTYPKARRLCHP